MIAPLHDADARRRVLTERDRSLLVEAGAGSGKTALMAGRVALLLADGVPPGSIAAITFTELAAAELADRIRRMAERLVEGEVPIELEVALPQGLTDERRERLRDGLRRLDDLGATTIHGFALDLIRPYPAEADMDPGARPMDPDEASLLFDDVFEGWLRERLATPEPGDDVVARMALNAPTKVVKELRQLALLVGEHPELATDEPATGSLDLPLADAAAAIDAVVVTLDGLGSRPEGCEKIEGFREILAGLRDRTDGPVATAFALLHERPSGPFNKNGALPKSSGVTKKYWEAAAAACGRSKADGGRAYRACDDAYKAFCELFAILESRAVELILARATRAVAEVQERYARRKREGALLDFDDLLVAAVRLLRTHADVRDALAGRYTHVLVDEFQDTDPRQAEIVWRLTGTPGDHDDWRAWPARGASRFVVGDPKQSIYRFRRADVNTYLHLRASMAADPGADVVSITTNFRSRPGILDATNLTFAGPLAAPDGPGYEALTPHRESGSAPAVARMKLRTPEGADPAKGPNVDAAREREAEAVARLCVRLVRGDPELGLGPVPATEIALLAPSGTDLWRYERQLENHGVAVASQAGKGFYGQQEVQDLVALARTLADPSDTLAFAALLRGPLVGVTEERMLDAVEEVRAAADPERADRVRLHLHVDPESVSEESIRRVLQRLQPLSRQARARTPYATLAAAVEQLEVRAIVRQRHHGQSGRALANVERFLESARPWSVRGLRAFARDAHARWSDGERAIEGRPDAAEDAVTLITVHSAKGLEWDVVVPINTLGEPLGIQPPFVDRHDSRLWWKLNGFAPAGWDDGRRAEEAERAAERVRLLYVAVTRAKDLLVVPDPGWTVSDGCWLGLTSLHELEGHELPPGDVEPLPAPKPHDAAQDAATFADEARRIHDAIPRIEWSAPSRHEATPDAGPQPLAVDDELVGDPPTAADPDSDPDIAPDEAPEPIAGRGWIRGLVLHALMEGLVTGEFEEDDLEASADLLTDRLLSTRERAEGEADTGRPDAAEMAGVARRAWNAPELAAIRADLVAEMNLYDRVVTGGVENLTSGIADAVAVDAEGRPYEVIDWKSDVNPGDGTIAAYREQVRTYLRLTGAERGRLVFLTDGRVVEVTAHGP